jgi:hypothetical protein
MNYLCDYLKNTGNTFKVEIVIFITITKAALKKKSWAHFKIRGKQQESRATMKTPTNEFG